jgi:hypothetical protein
MGVSWLDLLGASLGGGLVVKILDFLYLEYGRRREASETSHEIVNRHLDPVLKAADELVGKLRSLAQHDFVEFKHHPGPKNSLAANIEITNFVYLFAQFWARVQILRIEGLYVNLASDDKGKKLKSFLNTLETRGVRVVDRPRQRGMGESLIEQRGNSLSALTYHQFVQRYQDSVIVREWFEPLQNRVVQISHTQHRQQFLLYGAVLHALIDTLDPEHVITQDRPSWPNKLTTKSRRDLNFRIFKIYLPFVPGIDKYVAWQNHA